MVLGDELAILRYPSTSMVNAT